MLRLYTKMQNNTIELSLTSQYTHRFKLISWLSFVFIWRFNALCRASKFIQYSNIRFVNLYSNSKLEINKNADAFAILLLMVENENEKQVFFVFIWFSST